MQTISVYFSDFARSLSNKMGRPAVFIFAFVSIILWLTLGPYFQFSDTWELVINTVTSIITFLMVFLLQHTQNRDTSAMHLKLDEIIRSLSSSHNELLKAEELSDEELEKMIKVYEGLALTIKNKRKKGQSVDDCPEIDIENNKED